MSTKQQFEAIKEEIRRRYEEWQRWFQERDKIAVKEEISRRWKEWLEWLCKPWWFQERDKIAKFTGWVAAYTAILVFVSFLQFCTLQKAEQSNRIIQRAYVFSTGLQMIGVGPTDGSAAPTYILGWRWENGGTTPTRNLTVNVLCWEESHSIMDSAKNFHRIPKGGQPLFLGPKANSEIGHCSVQANEIAKIQKEGISFYFTGRADYQDVFDDTWHVTEICAEVTPITGDPMRLTPGLGHTAITCPALNCADEECSREK